MILHFVNYRECCSLAMGKFAGPGFDPRRYQIFWIVVGLERGPLSLVRSVEELLEWKKVATPGLENRD